MAEISLCICLAVLFNFCCIKALAGPISEGSEESLKKDLDFPPMEGGRIRSSPPQYMLELYSDVSTESQGTGSSAPYGATTITAVPVAEGRGDTFFFLAPNISKSEELLEVEFHLYHGHLRDPEHRNHVRGQSILYKVEASVHGSTDTYTQLVSGTGGGWLRFRVGRSSVLSELVKECSNSDSGSNKTNTAQSRDRNEQNHACNRRKRLIAISVKAITENGRPVRMRLHHGDNVAARKSILVFFTKSLETSDHLPLAMKNSQVSSRARVRRSLLSDSVPTSSSMTDFNSSQTLRETHTCVRQPLMIDFSRIGWSWIVAPASYNAYFCSGSCGFPLGQHQNPTNHATLMALVRALGEDSGPPEPQCVPSSYARLSVLYVDPSQNVILKSYGKMVVQSCGCRWTLMDATSKIPFGLWRKSKEIWRLILVRFSR